MRVSTQKTNPTASTGKAAATKPLSAKDLAALRYACDKSKLGTACAAPKDLSNFRKTQLQTAYPAVKGCSPERDEVNVYQSKTAPQILFIEDKSSAGTKWTRMTKIPTVPTVPTHSSR
jgi:hypothetical protein